MPNPSLHPGAFGQREISPRDVAFLEAPEPVIPHKWTVYRTRNYGKKIPRDEVRRTATIGLLRVWRDRDQSLRAALRSTADSGHLLGQLVDVELIKLDRGGVLLGGIEHTHASDGKKVVLMPFRQAWWCLPA